MISLFNIVVSLCSMCCLSVCHVPYSRFNAVHPVNSCSCLGSGSGVHPVNSCSCLGSGSGVHPGNSCSCLGSGSGVHRHSTWTMLFYVDVYFYVFMKLHTTACGILVESPRCTVHTDMKLVFSSFNPRCHARRHASSLPILEACRDLPTMALLLPTASLKIPCFDLCFGMGAREKRKREVRKDKV